MSRLLHLFTFVHCLVRLTDPSNIQHIEEIRAAGLELPVVNQIEVSTDHMHVSQRKQ